MSPDFSQKILRRLSPQGNISIYIFYWMIYLKSVTFFIGIRSQKIYSSSYIKKLRGEKKC